LPSIGEEGSQRAFGEASMARTMRARDKLNVGFGHDLA
jgi:hypothetical protein